VPTPNGTKYVYEIRIIGLSSTTAYKGEGSEKYQTQTLILDIISQTS
jgi:hypothetical protein